MKKIATRAAPVPAITLALAVLTGAAQAAGPDRPRDVIVMAHLSGDNAAIGPQGAASTGRAVAAVIAGLNLQFGDRLMLTGVGDTVPEGWSAQVHELRYQGAQPADAPAFVAGRIAELPSALSAAPTASLPPPGTRADILWAIERLATDCPARETTLIVISDMVGAGSRDGDNRFSIEGVPGTPHAGCDRLVWVGVGLGGDYPKGIVRAAEAVLVDLGRQIGFSDVALAR